MQDSEWWPDDGAEYFEEVYEDEEDDQAEPETVNELEVSAFAACLGIGMTEAEVADFVQCEVSAFVAHQGLQQSAGGNVG